MILRQPYKNMTALALIFAMDTRMSAVHAQQASTAVTELKIEEIVVTGSRIPRLNETSQSPIAVLSSKEAKFQGVTHAEDLLNSLPQVNAGLTAGALGPTGTATVDLRGFGAFRTLVLMDGRRLNPGDPINPSADLNAVPAALIKRVEVLTGGASSIYGSDAIAGVVNFIMDKNFNGAQLDAQYGINQDSNNNDSIKSILRASGITPSSKSTIWDGGTVDLTATYGTHFGRDDGGHITVYAGYRHTTPILANSRDRTNCLFVENGASFSCLLNVSSAAGTFNVAGATDTFMLDPATGNTFRLFDQNRDGYNAGLLDTQSLQRKDTRFDVGFFADYKIVPAVEAYLEGQYSADKTLLQYDPSNTLGNVFGINCNNPLLSADQVNSLCTVNGLASTDVAQVAIGKYNVEGSPRLDDFRHRSLRLVFGLKGKIDAVWSYDTYINYGIARSDEYVSNDLSLNNIANALNVVSVGGVPTCQVASDGCVPYNIFQVGGVTPAALKYISASSEQHGYATHTVLSAVVNGRLEGYGLKSPLATEGVGIALGVEYRTETIKNSPSANLIAGDLSVTSPNSPVQGGYNVKEVFGELHVPLVEDKPFFDKLALELSDRYAKYSLQGSVNSYNVGLEWAPIRDIRFRSSLSQAIRAPNGHELFLANFIAKSGTSDPCSGLAPTATLAQCQLTGVTAAQYGTIADAGTFNILRGGNINLKPETARTLTLGAVLTPSKLSHFSFSVDYWRIKVSKYDGQYNAVTTLNTCLNSGNSIFCGLVSRDSSGSLSTGNSLTSGYVRGTNVNTGSFEQSGIDFASSYALELDDAGLHHAGRLAFSFTGDLALKSKINIDATVPTFDCTGFYGLTCTGEGPTSPISKWRHQLRTTWSAPRGIELSINWRYIGVLNSELTSANPHLNGDANGNPVSAVDARIPAYNYFDLAANADVAKGINVRLGVNNIFNKPAPLVGNNNNPQLLGGNQLAPAYDTLGRYVFVGVTAKY